MYNVFKRPMFKRGGTAQGSGIMSTVEPKPVPRISWLKGVSNYYCYSIGQLGAGAGNEIIRKQLIAIY
jgi:hypothetical protein